MPSLTAHRMASWLVVLFCLANSTLLMAQSTGGRILGRVADPSGAVLAGVNVSLVNEATGVAQQAQTNSTGDYGFPQVTVGTYRIEATSPVSKNRCNGESCWISTRYSL